MANFRAIVKAEYDALKKTSPEEQAAFEEHVRQEMEEMASDPVAVQAPLRRFITNEAKIQDMVSISEIVCSYNNLLTYLGQFQQITRWNPDLRAIATLIYIGDDAATMQRQGWIAGAEDAQSLFGQYKFPVQTLINVTRDKLRYVCEILFRFCVSNVLIFFRSLQGEKVIQTFTEAARSANKAATTPEPSSVPVPTAEELVAIRKHIRVTQRAINAAEDDEKNTALLRKEVRDKFLGYFSMFSSCLIVSWNLYLYQGSLQASRVATFRGRTLETCSSSPVCELRDGPMSRFRLFHTMVFSTPARRVWRCGGCWQSLPRLAL